MNTTNKYKGWIQLFLAVTCILFVIVMGISCCTPTWEPNKLKIVIYFRDDLERGTFVTVPPADLVIIPIEVDEEESLDGYDFYVKRNGTENYIDIYLRDTRGNTISNLGRTCNGVTWNLNKPPGTYYLYLGNEFCSTHAKKVFLKVMWK